MGKDLYFTLHKGSTFKAVKRKEANGIFFFMKSNEKNNTYR